jgi:hypothetical protein
MRFFKFITSTVILLGTCAISQAADSGIYAGLGLGKVNASISSGDSLPTAFKGNDVGYKFILGVRPLDWLAAEVNYLDLGNPDSGIYYADTNGLSVSALAIKNVMPMLDVFAKGGLVNWKAKISNDTTKLLDRGGTNPVYGGGLIVRLLDLSVRAEYEHFNIDQGGNLVSASVTWTFF